MNILELSKHRKATMLMHPNNYSNERNQIIDQKLNKYTKKLDNIKNKN